MFQLLVEALVRTAGHQLREHIGSGGIATAVEMLASNQKQGFGDMAFSGAGVAGDDQPLLPPDKVQFGDLQDLCFVHPGLEAKIEVRKELAIREPGLLDSSFDPSFDPGVGLDGQQPFQELGGGKGLLGSASQLLIKNLLDSQKLQGLQMLPDSGQGLLRHGRGPLRAARCIDPGAAA